MRGEDEGPRSLGSKAAAAPLWNVGAPDPGAAARSYNDEDTPLPSSGDLSGSGVRAIRYSRLRPRVNGLRFSCLGIHTLTDGLLITSRIELPALGTAAVRRGRHRPGFGVRESLPHPQQVAHGQGIPHAGSEDLCRRAGSGLGQITEGRGPRKCNG
jgi:hypothetical protein